MATVSPARAWQFVPGDEVDETYVPDGRLKPVTDCVPRTRCKFLALVHRS
jgi:hypothetical protein